MKVGVAALLAAALACGGASAADKASAVMKDADGKEIGTLELTPEGDGVRIKGKLSGLTPGEHAFHIHETGKCEPPFTTAGGHFNPDGSKHGKVDGGQHAGDMDNLKVGDDGTVAVDALNELVSLKKEDKETVFDADGSAIVVHAAPDDYKSQPAGNAGPRVACGVIQ